jgi:hypothetical protein
LFTCHIVLSTKLWFQIEKFNISTLPILEKAYFANMMIISKAILFKIGSGCIVMIVFFFKTNVLVAQITGCTDPFANNYNAAASINNGTCTYSSTSYTPPVKTDPISDTLIESSGLQMANGELWSFNDRNAGPIIYKIDSLSKTILQTVYLTGATNIDWEDIAFDGTHLYIGDFGNNLDGARTDLKIYKFPISSIPPHTTSPIVNLPADQIEVINFKYADQPQPPAIETLNHTRYDCEAMLVDNGEIHLFTKNWLDLTSTHYIINSTNAGSYLLNPVETLATNYLVTAADKALGQNIIALLGYQNSGVGNHFMYLLSNYSNGFLFNGNKRKIDLPNATLMGQGEGITFRDDSTGYISNEKFVYSFIGFNFTVNQKLRAFNIGSFVSNFSANYIFTGNGNWSVAANWKSNLMPPVTLPANSKIIIDPAGNGECIVDIPYTVATGEKIIVQPNKKLFVKGNLIITK